MSERRVLFVDRDGTLIEEPPDERVDRLEKIRLLPDVIPALLALKRAGFRLVMVTNQDGLGTPALPQDAFDRAHRFTLDLFASQGISFDAVFICPHFLHEACGCRKPKIGLVEEYLKNNPIEAARSFMVGDRDTDLEFARNIGVEGLRVRVDGAAAESWPAIADRILGAPRRARTERTTRETRVVVEVDLSREGPSRIATGSVSSITCSSKSPSTAASRWPSNARAICRSTSITRSRTARSRWVRRCARPWATRAVIGRYGFVLAMDEAEAQVALDLSGRPYFVWDGRFNRERIGDLPTELVPHFFRSLCDPRSHPAPARERREHASHGRVLFQGRGPSVAASDPPRGQRAAIHQGHAVSRDIVIVACGGANIASLKFALERLDAPAEVSSDAQRIRRASHVILPWGGRRTSTPWRACARAASMASFPRSRSRCSASVSACSCCTSLPRRGPRCVWA
jgi:imidazoleglycerol-phosphate dehydratase/histidinol-phosphatase